MKSETAKVLHPVLGQPLAAWPIARALELGCAPVVAVVGYQGPQVQAALEQRFPGAPLRFATQERQAGHRRRRPHRARRARRRRGSGAGALRGHATAPAPDARVAGGRLPRRPRVRWPWSRPRSPTPPATGASSASPGRLTGVVEERDCTADQRDIHEVNAGVYVFDAAFLRRGLAALTPSNAQGELYLTDLVAMAAREGEVTSVRADFEDTRGVNDRADLAACARVLRRRLNAGAHGGRGHRARPGDDLHRGRRSPSAPTRWSSPGPRSADGPGWGRASPWGRARC